jgi:hypothetical protein
LRTRQKVFSLRRITYLWGYVIAGVWVSLVSAAFVCWARQETFKRAAVHNSADSAEINIFLRLTPILFFIDWAPHIFYLSCIGGNLCQLKYIWTSGVKNNRISRKGSGSIQSQDYNFLRVQSGTSGLMAARFSSLMPIS